MSKLRKAILIIGILVIAVAASLGTALALYATGSMKTDPIELEFKLKEPQEPKIYDGTPLELSRVNFDNPAESDIELSKGSLASGHSIKVEFIGSQTNVGTSMSDANIKIYDENGFNVTNEYSIKVTGAPLKVVQRTISVELPAQKVVYNGSKVLFSDYKIAESSQGGLCNGHRIYGSTDASVMNVGDTISEDLTPLIFDTAGNDVTANYKIEEFNYKGIEVVPREITVRPVSYEKVYDGEETVANEIEFVDGSLVEGQTAEFIINDDYNNKLKDVGELDTTITSLQIFETVGGEKVDVTANYAFNLDEYSGFIKITPRPLTVTAKSAMFVYNGEEQSIKDDTQAESVDGLAVGEELYSVSYVSSLTDVGTVENVIGEVVLKGSSDNYEITTVNGTLEITPREVTFKTNSAEKFYDGDPLTEDRSECTTAKEGHEIRLPEGVGLPEITAVGEISNAYTIEIIDKDNGGEDVTSNYAITYDYGTLTVKRLPVKVTLQSDGDTREKVNYDSKTHTPTLGAADEEGNPENSQYFAVEPLLKEGEEVEKFTLDYTDFELVAETHAMCEAGNYYYTVKFRDGEQEERKLYANYELFVPESGILEITPLPVKVTLKPYVDVTDEDAGINIKNAFTYSGKAVKVDATDAIIEIKEGVTLPDDVQLQNLLTKEDFTVITKEIRGEGETASTVSVGEIVDAGDKYIYTVKIADSGVAKNFEITVGGLEEGAEGVSLTVKPMPVTVMLKEIVRTYNGEEQTVEVDEAVLGIRKTYPAPDEDADVPTGLLTGDLSVVYGVGGRVNASSEPNAYTYKVATAKKKAIKNYALTFENEESEAIENARMIINKFALEVTTDTKEFTYNGAYQSSGAYTCGALANESHSVVLTTTELPSVRDVSANAVTNTFKVAVFHGDTRVSDENYDITYKYGELSVKPCPITITTATPEAHVYDGNEFCDSTITTDITLFTGHTLNKVNVPSLVDVGKIDNVFSCDILRGGASVNDNFDITYDYGELEVVPCPITLITGDTGDNQKIYDGTPLINKSVRIKESALAAKYEVNPVGEASITDVGSVENRFDCTISAKSTREDVTGNFTVVYECSTLTVTPLSISFELSDFTNNLNVDMEYDGKPKKFTAKDAVESITAKGKDNATKKYEIVTNKLGTGVEFAESDFEIVYYTPIIDAGSYLYTVRFTDDNFANNFTVENAEEQMSCTVHVKQKPIEIVIKSFDGIDDNPSALTYSGAVQTISLNTAFSAILDKNNISVEPGLISVDDLTITYPEQLLNAGAYKYSVKIEDEVFAKNFLYKEAVAEVIMNKFDVNVSLKNYEQEYNGEEFEFPEDAVRIIDDYLPDGTPVTALIKPADFTFAAADGSRIVDARTYTYGATLSDEEKACNFNIKVVAGTDYESTVTIQQIGVNVSLRNVKLTFNGKEQMIDGASALDIVDQPLMTADDFSFEVTRDGAETAIKKAGTYSFTATLKNDNFFIIGNDAGVLGGGKVTVNKYEVTVTLNSLSKVYDGTEYALVSRAAIYAVDGDMFTEYDFTVDYADGAPADRSDAGEYTLKVGLAERFSDDIKESVEIAVENDTLTVTQKEITVTTPTDTFAYDGTEFTTSKAPVIVGEVSGHYARVKEDTVVKVTNVAAAPYPNTAKYAIYAKTQVDGEAVEKDVSANYKIIYVNGTLTVTPRTLRIKTGSASREYNGNALSNNQITVVSGLLADHTPVAPMDLPSITDVGKLQNKYSGVSVLDGGMTDVTENYVIEYEYGELEVKPAKIRVTFDGTGNIDYSGSAISLTGAMLINSVESVNDPTGTVKPAKDDFDVIFDGEVRNAGKYLFTVAVKGDKNPERYELVFAGDNTFTVNKIALNVTLKNYEGAAAEEYTGKAHTASLADVTSIGVSPNGEITADRLSLTYPEQMINVGTYAYGVCITDETLAGNYVLNVTGGNYEITPAKITVTLQNYETTYNGTANTVNVLQAIKNISGTASELLGKSDFNAVYEQELRLAGAHTYKVEITDREKSKNYTVAIAPDTGNFNIKKRSLTFTATNVYMSKQAYQEGGYADAITLNVEAYVSVSANTPLAAGDSIVITEAVAQREEEGSFTFVLYAVTCTLTNADCYEFTNLTGSGGGALIIQLIVY